MNRSAFALAVSLLTISLPTALAGETGVGISIDSPQLIESIPVVRSQNPVEDGTEIYLHSVRVKITFGGAPGVCPLGGSNPPCTPPVGSAPLLNVPVPIATTSAGIAPFEFEREGTRVAYQSEANSEVEVYQRVEPGAALLTLYHYRQVMHVIVRVDGQVSDVPIPIDYFVPVPSFQNNPPCNDECGGDFELPDEPLDCIPWSEQRAVRIDKTQACVNDFVASLLN